MESDPRPGSARLLVLGAGPRPRLPALLVAAGVVVALAWSGWRDVPVSWRLLRDQYTAYAGYTREQREQAFGSHVPLRMDILDFWRRSLRRDDRYWIQIPHEAFSGLADKKLVVRTVAHLYLLPAIEAPDLAHATIVLSWDADPGLLHLRFLEQARAGLQLVFASRIARDP